MCMFCRRHCLHTAARTRSNALETLDREEYIHICIHIYTTYIHIYICCMHACMRVCVCVCVYTHAPETHDREEGMDADKQYIIRRAISLALKVHVSKVVIEQISAVRLGALMIYVYIYIYIYIYMILYMYSLSLSLSLSLFVCVSLCMCVCVCA